MVSGREGETRGVAAVKARTVRMQKEGRARLLSPLLHNRALACHELAEVDAATRHCTALTSSWNANENSWAGAQLIGSGFNRETAGPRSRARPDQHH